MDTTRVANAESAASWDGPDGDHWTAYAPYYEQVSVRHWNRLVEAVPIASTASVLDVGCGTGRSTRDLGRIATDGEVLGVDLSSRMLERAREVAAADGLGNVTFEQGDAQVHPFRPESADVAVSVFGAMFFEDPVAAFGNIRRGLRPGGTLALLTWRELTRNEWLHGLRDALALGRELPEPPAGAPGPFGLADADQSRRTLVDSGFSEVRLESLEELMCFGRDVDDALAFIGSMGLTKGLLHDLGSAERDLGLANLRRLLEERESADGVLLGSSAWLITARVPE